MRARLATQVFSHSLAAGIFNHVSLGAMVLDAEYTSEFIEMVDGLFDCFNTATSVRQSQSRPPVLRQTQTVITSQTFSAHSHSNLQTLHFIHLHSKRLLLLPLHFLLALL